jgi:hypothetical protein
VRARAAFKDTARLWLARHFQKEKERKKEKRVSKKKKGGEIL